MLGFWDSVLHRDVEVERVSIRETILGPALDVVFADGVEYSIQYPIPARAA